MDDGSPKRRLPSLREFKDRPGELVLAAVDQGVHSRWEPAQRRAEGLAHLSTAAAVRQLTRTFQLELGAAGAAAGGTAAVPGVTATAVAAGVAEIGWSTLRLCDLVLTIGALHGHTDATVEQRRAWILAVLAYGDSAAMMLSKLTGDFARTTGKRATDAIPTPALQQVNRAIGRTIIKHYGTRRGAVAVGRLLPFGVGAGIGFGFNAALVQQVAGNADEFFADLPPGRSLPRARTVIRKALPRPK